MISTFIKRISLPGNIKEGLENAPSINKDIQNTLLSRYMEITISCMVSEPVFILLAYIVLLKNMPLIDPNIWLGISFIGITWKLITSWFYSKGYLKDNYNFWLNIVYIRILSTGIIWGSLASVFMPSNSHGQIIISLMILSIASWFTPSLAAVVKGYFLLLISIFLPYGIWLVQQDSNMYFSIIIISCWIVMMMATISFIRNLLITSLFLRYQVEELFKDSQKVNKDLVNEIHIRKEAEMKLEELANHDALTGLPNRAFFQNHFKEILEKSGSNGNKAAILFVDLDDFKPVNDQFGHEVGDLLLIEVAKRLKNSVHDSDVVARLGGDEFVMIITNLQSLNNLKILTDKIRTALCEPFDLNGHKDIKVSLSMGVSLYPEDDTDMTSIVKKADEAMYQSKRLGGNIVVFYQDLISGSAK